MRTATGESGSDIDLSPIRKLEERLDNFRIDVSGDITIAGSAWQGYALNVPFCPPETAFVCPSPCPSTATIRFSGVIMDGCCLSAPTSSSEVTDIGLFNDLDVVLGLDGNPGCCFYDYTGSPVSTMAVHGKIWFPQTDCSGFPFADRDFGIGDSLFVTVGCINGTWFVIAGLAGDLLFYATTTNIGSTVANELVSCDGTIVSRNLPGGDCSDFFTDTQSAGYNGTAIVTF